MRRTDREVTDDATKRQIIEAGKVINLALHDFPAPYVVPTNYGYEFVGNQLHIYLHGAPKGHKRVLIVADPNVSFSIIANDSLYTPEPGSKPSAYSYFYQSILGTGKAVLVDDLAEKEHALRLILKHQTGHEIADEISQQDLAYVGVIRIDVDRYTGKQHLAD